MPRANSTFSAGSGLAAASANAPLGGMAMRRILTAAFLALTLSVPGLADTVPV
jgi:hypothetical protein